MIKEEAYKLLKERYGKCASWAIWSLPESSNKDGSVDLNTKGNIGNLSIFEDENELLKNLNSNYIFVGLNPAEHKQKNEIETWTNFHSSDVGKSQDHKMRAALYETPFWGSFMIDVLPNIVKTKADEAVKQAKETDVSESVQNIKEIREILGGNAIIIAMGNKAYNILKKNLNDESICLKKITHYSYWIGAEKYKNRVIEQLKECFEE